MKTTIKLLIGLIILVTGILSFTNYNLAKQYATIDTEDQYHEYEQITDLDFNEIEINGGNELRLKIEKGESNSLFIHNHYTDKIDHENKDGLLKVNFHEDLTDEDYDPNEHDHYRNSPRVLITYTDINQLTSLNGNVTFDAIINDNLKINCNGNTTLDINLSENKDGNLTVESNQNSLIKLTESSESSTLNTAKFKLNDKSVLKIPSIQTDSLSLIMSPESSINCGSSVISKLH